MTAVRKMLGIVDDAVRSGVGHERYRSREAYDPRRVGAAAVYCSDGRFGEAIDEFLHVGLGLPRYDRVAAPGGAACLGRWGEALYEAEAMRRELQFLIRAHGLRRIVMIAHDNCGFYHDVWLGGKDLAVVQAEDLGRAAERIRAWRMDVDVEAYIARVRDGRVGFDEVGVGPKDVRS